jgi:hypothetical protein
MIEVGLIGSCEETVTSLLSVPESSRFKEEEEEEEEEESA